MRALVVPCLLLPLLTAAARAEDPRGAAADPAPSTSEDAPAPVDPSPTAAGNDVDADLPGWLPPLLVDEDTDLYLAQVVAGIGAEGLFGVCGLCMPLALGAGLVKPAAGALAVDWVGRELGGYQGWQVGALAASYGLQILGSGLIVLGSAGLYVTAILATVSASTTDTTVTTAFTMAMLGATLGSMGLGGAMLIARPWVVPLVWGITFDDVEVLDGAAQPPASLEPEAVQGAAATSDQPGAMEGEAPAPVLVVPAPDPGVAKPAPNAAAQPGDGSEEAAP